MVIKLFAWCCVTSNMPVRVCGYSRQPEMLAGVGSRRVAVYHCQPLLRPRVRREGLACGGCRWGCRWGRLRRCEELIRCIFPAVTFFLLCSWIIPLLLVHVGLRHWVVAFCIHYAPSRICRRNQAILWNHLCHLSLGIQKEGRGGCARQLPLLQPR